MFTVTRFAESGGADGRDRPASTAAEDGGLRASLRAIWASVAPSWGELAEHVDTRGAVVAQAMLDSAGLERGDRVLELACGPGGVGMAAAAIVGPDGAVVLSDIAPEMTAIAAERARNAGLTNVTTCEVDLERIDYPEAAFDKVLCREGLMLVPDPASAVREARRILRPAGRAVFAVWGPVTAIHGWACCSTRSRPRRVWPSRRLASPGRSRLKRPAHSASCWLRPGSPALAVREIPTPMKASSVDEWWSVVPSLAGPLARVLGSLPAEVSAAIRARVDAAMADFATPDGYELPGVSILGVGRR